MKCDTCIFPRGIVSENGWHYICCLSEKEAMECLRTGNHYAWSARLATKRKIDRMGEDGRKD